MHGSTCTHVPQCSRQLEAHQRARLIERCVRTMSAYVKSMLEVSSMRARPRLVRSLM